MEHITDLQIDAFYQKQLSARKERELLEHCAGCVSCSGRLAARFPESGSLSPPPDMADQIMDLAVGLPVRRQREYRRYCTRLALGMCLSLCLIAGSNFVQRPVPADRRAEYQHQAQQAKEIQERERERFLMEQEKENEKWRKDHETKKKWIPDIYHLHAAGSRTDVFRVL